MKPNECHSDAELWSAFRKGDRLAYEEMYRKHFSDLQHYGLHLCHDQEHVLDAIHSLFFDLWVRKEHLGNTDNIRYYLLRGLRRLITHQLVRQRKRQASGPAVAAADHSFEAKLIEKQSQEEMHQKLRQALQKLPPRQQEIIFLKFYENLSYEEISSLTSLKVRTVYNTVFQALEGMRSLITQHVKWSVLLMLHHFHSLFH
ncbi:RNA polymerase sigma factor [Catalinimonas niigatensis]|uniref:RNA polymerase sigma factor n=1 Tax=Catalinimonas niigatensis TaxID=1397264 RepID=UPI002664E3D8|nr:sigma-70 family RNA polymerase sigma factor [Catalinimonas niigatensis]WPP50072.1 sigma-70 family RNA polymerase sigma factor [Catalinimonas niigatensis]